MGDLRARCSRARPANISGTETLTWNTKKTTTVKTLKLVGVTGKVTQTNATGAVTAGLFVGSKQSGTLNYVPLAKGCISAPLSKVSFTAETPIKIG